MLVRHLFLYITQLIIINSEIPWKHSHICYIVGELILWTVSIFPWVHNLKLFPFLAIFIIRPSININIFLLFCREGDDALMCAARWNPYCNTKQKKFRFHGAKRLENFLRDENGMCVSLNLPQRTVLLCWTR